MSDEFDEFNDFAMDDLEELDRIEAEAYSVARDPYFTLPPRAKASTSQQLQQRDLFGGKVQEKEKRVVNQGGAGASGSKVITVARVVAVKKWDRASFAMHGWSKKNAAATKAKAKGKGKARAYASDEEAWGDEVEDDEEDEEIILDPDFDPTIEPPDIKWQPDAEQIKTWYYPVQDDKPLRTYQYNIVHSALFENTLVSLPTGLGKTFIAACVMLNFYRWYPKGKIIFLAPTRPLVTQQIKACHYIAGIAQEDCIELTGQTAPALRAIAWKTKRVVYSTPQTVENDLKKGRLDPRDVSCLVVDEAHRASGDYAYVGVVRYLMSVNPHFRVLALTATPGAKAEAVQDVIDNLHIGKIEVRTDQSMDITRYIHNKTYNLLVVPLPLAIAQIRDLFGSLMKIPMGRLLGANLMYEKDPTMVSPFGVMQINPRIKTMPGGSKANGRYYLDVKILGKMARAMEYLLIQSMTSFHSGLKDLESEGPKWLLADQKFKEVCYETGACVASPGYIGHPKMERLTEMCLEHFEKAAGEVDEYGEKKETRVMVFCNFRAVVDEIVEVLNRHSPAIKATEFVGQASAKGKSGKTQKQQIETIRKFKKGVYNVLVATSIGEEGLDIGEIDLIVCYEANKSPIRMLQRVGRTGRARDGEIIVLMTEGREEKNWDRAKDAYTEVQNAIVSGKVFELYNDGDRMVPKGLKPAVEKVKITAQPLKIELMTMAGSERLIRRNTAEEKKVKKKRDVNLNVPKGATLGFKTARVVDEEEKAVMSATQMLRKRKKAVYLTPDEESELFNRWQFSGGREIKMEPIDISSLTLDQTHAALPHIMRHASSRHRQLKTTLRTIASLGGEDPEPYEEWFQKMSKAFKQKYVTLWSPPSTSTRIKKPHVSVRRHFPVVPATTDSYASGSGRPQSSAPNAPAPAPKIVKSRLPKIEDEDMIVLSDSDIALSPTPPRIPSPVIQPKALPTRTTSHEAVRTMQRTLSKQSTSYSMLDDTMNDSEEEYFAAAMAGTKGFQKASKLVKIDSPPFVAPRPLLKQSSTLIIPDSEEDELLPIIVPPRPKALKKRSSSPAVVKPKLPSSEDEFGDFEMDDADMEEFAAFEAAALAGQGQKRSRDERKAEEVDELEDEIEDVESENEMAPPQKLHKSSHQPSRPALRQIPDSPASIPPRTASKREPDISSMDSPVVAVRRVNKARARAIVESSSPQEEAGGHHRRPAALPTAQQSASNSNHVAAPLRRGRPETARTPAAVDEGKGKSTKKVSTKGRKTKKLKMDEAGARKTGLFDFEAINSGASNTESSSEGYDEENSQDRRFVDEDHEEEADISSGQHQFYKDSLRTQPPNGFARPHFMNRALGSVGKKIKHSRQILSQPEEPRSDDRWSYDSFCVADEEEVEYELSSRG